MHAHRLSLSRRVMMKFPSHTSFTPAHPKRHIYMHHICLSAAYSTTRIYSHHPQCTHNMRRRRRRFEMDMKRITHSHSAINLQPSRQAYFARIFIVIRAGCLCVGACVCMHIYSLCARPLFYQHTYMQRECHE